MLVQSIEMRMHCINACIETNKTDDPLEKCDHVIVELSCHPERGSFLSISVNPREFDKQRKASSDLGLSLVLDFTKKEAVAFVYAMKTMIKHTRWYINHPAPAAEPKAEEE